MRIYRLFLVTRFHRVRLLFIPLFIVTDFCALALKLDGLASTLLFLPSMRISADAISSARVL